jgi:hypothetical protein
MTRPSAPKAASKAKVFRTRSGLRAILNDSIEARCYAYKASASSSLPCNNTDTPCTRVTITTLLEKNHTASRVTFDRNNEIEE